MMVICVLTLFPYLVAYLLMSFLSVCTEHMYNETTDERESEWEQDAGKKTFLQFLVYTD